MDGERQVIESGLQPGEVVVTDGVDKLTQGAKVSVRQPGAKGGPGGKGKGSGGGNAAAATQHGGTGSTQP
jgi:multidrug efflux system membrane fusion protein